MPQAESRFSTDATVLSFPHHRCRPPARAVSADAGGVPRTLIFHPDGQGGLTLALIDAAGKREAGLSPSGAAALAGLLGAAGLAL